MEHTKPKRKDIMVVFEKLLNDVERNTCYHEETHRGGAIWTICSRCGKEWADDRGGFVPHVDKEHIKQAREMIQRWKETK